MVSHMVQIVKKVSTVVDVTHRGAHALMREVFGARGHLHVLYQSVAALRARPPAAAWHDEELAKLVATLAQRVEQLELSHSTHSTHST